MFNIKDPVKSNKIKMKNEVSPQHYIWFKVLNYSLKLLWLIHLLSTYTSITFFHKQVKMDATSNDTDSTF